MPRTVCFADHCTLGTPAFAAILAVNALHLGSAHAQARFPFPLSLRNTFLCRVVANSQFRWWCSGSPTTGEKMSVGASRPFDDSL